MAKSMADMVREQAEFLKSRPRPEPRVEQKHEPFKPRVFTRAEALHNFLEDRNYTGKEIERPDVYDAGRIREWIIKENPEEYVDAEMRGHGVELRNASMDMIERYENNPYKQFHTDNQGENR